jgi:hypothetical protein
MIETRTVDANGDSVKEVIVDSARIGDSAVVGNEPAVPRLGQSMGLDSHDTSHLYQLGSQSNPHH